MTRVRALRPSALLAFVLFVACATPSSEVSIPPPTTDAGTPPPAPPPPAGSLKVVAAADLRTAEDGAKATFTVALGSAPSSTVTVPIVSSTETEVRVEPSALTFTPSDWARPRTVTLAGQNDDVADGDRKIDVRVGPAASSDGAYNGMTAPPIHVTNADDDTPGFEISAPSASGKTNEVGGKSTFTVRLRSRPVADVTVAISSSAPGEGTADTSSITFTPASWNQPLTVTVTGQNDDVADGDRPYAIVLGKAASPDPAYAARDPEDVKLVNEDDDVPGLFVSAPAPGATTTEAGGTASFTVRLRSRPTADVTVAIVSSKPLEGQTSVTELVFTPATYADAQTVTVMGQDDPVDDGDQAFAVAVGPITSADALYAGVAKVDVALTNTDDDTAAVMVSALAPSNMTTEAGGQVTFTVRLASAPTADVTIPVSSSKPLEGAVTPSSLVFTAADWSTPQTVTVTGQDDAVDDGDQAYSIVLAQAVSGDAKYAALNPADPALLNVDDDAAGIAVSAASPSNQTTEAGGQVTFSVVLSSQPTANVTIPVSSSQATEATPDKAQLVFTPADWSIPQTVTVTGLDDAVDDGDKAYAVVLGAATSADAKYAGTNPADVALVNVDDDTAGIVVSSPQPGDGTTETGGQVSFTIVLATQPTANVTIPITSTKPAEGLADKVQVVFTPANWATPQSVTVTGQADAVDDGDQPYAIVLAAAASADAKYAGMDPGDVALVNSDACGNGNTDVGEQCDDANTTTCDGCESCQRRRWLNLPAGARATIPGIAAALPVGNMCVEAWAKIGIAGDAIIASSYSVPANGAFILRCNSDQIQFGADNGGLLAASALASGCGDGEWHHFAGCRAVAGGTATLTVFLDGVLRATSSGPATRLGANTTMVLGGTTYASEGLGSIDEVRVSNNVRYTANFGPARRLTADVNTVALFHLDEGTGATFKDDAGAYTGTATAGGSWSLDTGYNLAVCQ